MNELDRKIVALLLDGLPLVSRPWQAVAAQIGCSEATLLSRVRVLREQGVLRRLGAVVRHHELGFVANGMAVWDVPDGAVREIGARLSREPRVTLCYRRDRVADSWPYNLYAMVHGRSRADVEQTVADMSRRLGLDHYPHALLFSIRRFKQCAGRYIGEHESRGRHAAA